jgi:hypothetical protein
VFILDLYLFIYPEFCSMVRLCASLLQPPAVVLISSGSSGILHISTAIILITARSVNQLVRVIDTQSETSGSHSGADDDSSRLGCYVVSTGKQRRFEESKCRHLQRQARLRHFSWTC